VNAILVQATVYVPAAIIGEAVLSFLGLGVRPPTPSLGVMLANAQQFYHDGPWMAVFPGVIIVVLTLALNLLGDGLRDALDPKENR
jgi:peptide/nickel transport system permease protein